MNNLENIISNLTEEQKHLLEKLGKNGLANLTPQKASNIAKELGLDLNAIQACIKEIKNIQQKHKPQKIGQNEKCSCGSGIKFKKCCFGKV